MQPIEVIVPLDSKLPVLPDNLPCTLEPIKGIAEGDSSNLSGIAEGDSSNLSGIAEGDSSNLSGIAEGDSSNLSTPSPSARGGTMVIEGLTLCDVEAGSGEMFCWP